MHIDVICSNLVIHSIKAMMQNSLTCGCMGSAKLHIRIREGVMIILADWSILSSHAILSATDTASTPLIVGCQSIHVIVFSLLNCRSVKDWYS
jgi:hypothetical protein